MKTQAVIDLGFGDSGKGLVTAFLCSKSKNPLVIRFSGGSQAGHTVIHKNIRHIFSSFGSGTLQGVPTYWSKNCTFDPNSFNNEYCALIKNGISPIIYVNKKCPVTTPFEIIRNISLNSINNHGTCGVGFGETIQREEDHHSILAEDIEHLTVLHEKLVLNYRYTLERIKELPNDFTHDDIINMHKLFLLECSGLMKQIKEKGVIKLVSDSDYLPFTPTDYIYESSQGLLLDKDIGFFPHVTRSNVGFKAIDTDVDEIFYVTRAYQTRHGNGPMTNEKINHNIKENPHETNTYHKYQGHFRRTLLDIDLLKYALMKDNPPGNVKKNLVITCLDHVENEHRYTIDGKVECQSTEERFIKAIFELLGGDFDDVYISKSDKYSNIRKANVRLY